MAKFKQSNLEISDNQKLIFDTTKMKSLGLSCPTLLSEGLQKTYAWFLENQNNL